MNIIENCSLKNYNTFRIDSKAKYFASINNFNEVKPFIKSEIFQKENKLFLGGGSNLLFLEDYNGLVVHIQIKGMKIVKSSRETVVFDVGAGENWHNFVKLCLNNNYYGLENLALIPGNIGPAPVQNIGAYGVEQKDFFVSCQGYDLEQDRFRTLSYNDCKFGYRDSIFKNELKDKFIVTSVRYKLTKTDKVNISYKALSDELLLNNIITPKPKDVFETVCRIREEKLPNPDLIGNAGSFFKNPVIPVEQFDNLIERFPSIPSFPSKTGLVKIPAAWLIEQCGWKGKRMGDVGVHEKHSLILVNYGNASGREIFNLSEQIIQSVKYKFGIVLNREVLVIS